MFVMNNFKKISIVLLFGNISLVIYWLQFSYYISTKHTGIVVASARNSSDGYVVFTNSCVIKDFDPLAEDVMSIFTKQYFKNCSNKQPLTSIEQDYASDVVKIVLHKELIPKYQHIYHTENIFCYYQNISRAASDGMADNEIKLLERIHFSDTVVLPQTVEFVLVFCEMALKFTWSFVKTNVYTNAHAFVRRKSSSGKFDALPSLSSPKKSKVMLIGIDSISRLNLLRAMPQTAQYLHNSGWFTLEGYTKINDNTLPNFFAIFTGLNSTIFYNRCDPRQVGGLDKCTYMWNQFEKEGFVTAFAEDDVDLMTFNFFGTGFVKQPTNHYFRPFGLAAEKYLNIEKKHKYMTYCLGQQHNVDYIYKYALDFATVYKNHSHFGFFWTNSFSHQDLSDPSAMDEKTMNFLMEFENREILNDTIIFFFSDHGMRFGPIRKLLTGWYEERMPFMYIWLPTSFQLKFPNYVKNLSANRNRLTSPYDFYMTLQHLLLIFGKDERLIEPAESCPKCQSLLNRVPLDRSCEDAGINKHWCTCVNFEDTNKSLPIISQAVGFVLRYLNEYIEKNYSKLCALLKLGNILKARVSITNDTLTTDYLVSFVAEPSKAELEATVRYSTVSNNFELIGTVSRLNRYGEQSACIRNDKELMKYCYCI